MRKYVDQGVIRGVRLGKHRYAEKAELDRIMGVIAREAKGTAIYTRVSTKKQRDAGNLDRQKERLLTYCAAKKLKVVGTFEDIASGLNENRRGLKNCLGFRRGEIDTVVVEYKDRLARFGFEYLKGSPRFL